MKKKFFIPLAALLVLALTFSLWYTRPRSFWDATGMDPHQVTAVSGWAMEGSTAQGEAQLASWSLAAVSPGQEDYEALVSILERGNYRAHLSNLAASFGDSQPGSDRWVTLNFSMENGTCTVDIPLAQTITTPVPQSTGYHCYASTDSQLQTAIFQFFQTNGENS